MGAIRRPRGAVMSAILDSGGRSRVTRACASALGLAPKVFGVNHETRLVFSVSGKSALSEQIGTGFVQPSTNSLPGVRRSSEEGVDKADHPLPPPPRPPVLKERAPSAHGRPPLTRPVT